MSATFDPYLQWLGIREKQRPVNHYRLLGLELYEGEANVVAQAADRQMAHIRQFQAGEYSEAADKLLNELATARLCLLKPERKAEYDRRLRERLAPIAAPEATPGLAARPLAPQPLRQQPPGMRPASGNASRLPAQESGYSSMPMAIEQPPITPPIYAALGKGARSSLGMWATLGGLTVVVLALVAILINRNPKEDPIAQSPTPPNKVQPVTTPTNVPVETTSTPETPVTPMPTPPVVGPANPIEPKTPPTPTPTVVPPAEVKTPTTPTTPAVTPTAPKTVPTTQPKSTTPEVSTPKVEPSPTTPPKMTETKPLNSFEEAVASLGGSDPAMMPGLGESTKPTPVKATIPDKATIAAKTKEVREIFKGEYVARDADARASLARRLHKSALDTRDDPATVYVLVNESRDQAVQGGDYETMTLAGQILTDTYDVDTNEEDIAAFAKLQNFPGKPANWYRGLFTEINDRADLAQARDDYDRAARYANIAKALAVKANDTSTVQSLTLKIKELGSLKTQFAKYKASQETLRTKPDDPTANGEWGVYLSLVKGDFAAGLPHLVKGTDALAKLAQREAVATRDAAETMAIADEWWNYAEKNKDSLRLQARRHAGELYQVALPELKGLAIAKVEKRLEEIAADPLLKAGLGGKQLEKVLIAKPWTMKWANVAQARFGRFNGGNGNNPQDTEETINFYEGGRVDSRYFDTFEIKNDVIELRFSDGGSNPPLGTPGVRQLRGKAMLVGPELRILYYREDRPNNPINRGIGQRARNVTP